MTPQFVADYLSRRQGREVQVDAVSRSAGGLSRETWFVRGPDMSLVLRCDLPGGVSSCPVPLSFEYEMHRRLPRAGLPVTRALWFEEDLALLGRLFYVRECVDGSSTIPGFDQGGPEGDEIRIAVSREHVRAMAAVHMTDWRDLGLGDLMPAPAAPRDCGRAAVRRLATSYQALELPPNPLFARAFDWFLEHAPESSPAVALCKGSNGAMQEIWRDHHIVGLSDWELASLGDPASDWARCVGYLPTVGDRWNPRAAFDYYEELTGFAIHEQAVVFYKALYWLEMAIVGLHAGAAVRRGALLDARLLFLATYAVHTAEVRLAEIMELRPA